MFPRNPESVGGLWERNKAASAPLSSAQLLFTHFQAASRGCLLIKNAFSVNIFFNFENTKKMVRVTCDDTTKK